MFGNSNIGMLSPGLEGIAIQFKLNQKEAASLVNYPILTIGIAVSDTKTQSPLCPRDLTLPIELLLDTIGTIYWQTTRVPDVCIPAVRQSGMGLLRD